MSRGTRAEHRCLEVLRARGWRELLHDVKCAGVQIDVIGRAPSGVLTIVEVKMNTAFDLARVTPRQLARLDRAARTLAEVEPIDLVLALVEDARVRLLPMEAALSY